MTEKNIFLYKLPPPAESGPLNLEGGGGVHTMKSQTNINTSS